MSKTFNFAHLIGLATSAAKTKGSAKGRRAEGPLDDDGDQQYAKGQRAEEDDEDEPEAEDEDDEPDARKARKARGKRAEEDDEDEPEAEDEDDEPAARKARKARGKRAEEDDEDEPEAEDEDDEPSARKAVRADRRRCAAIIAYGVANGCAEQAGILAFDTNMSKGAAIDVLKANGNSGRAPAGALGRRMSQVNVHQVGPEASRANPALPKGCSRVAAGIINAGR